ncbi:MAG: hypothetical protein Q8L48_08130 [Archangium sp.]|nr:hypothetical protein [Archangium sp.]
MHSFKCLIASFVVAATAFAQPVGELVIRTRDGKSRQGRVLSETKSGYLFTTAKGTSVIPFETIIDMRSANAEPPELEPRNAEAAPVAIASAAPATVATAPAASEAVPPPPPPPAAAPVGEASASAPDSTSARGFHFGLGVSAGGGRLGFDAGGHGVFDFNFGKTGFRLGLNLALAVGYGAGFLGSIDGLLHINLSDFYTLGVGAQVGAIIGDMNVFFVGPVLQPVVIKLGDRGQHQLALTATVGFANYLDRELQTARYGATAGYTYLF